jgi:hypothetical protein
MFDWYVWVERMVRALQMNIRKLVMSCGLTIGVSFMKRRRRQEKHMHGQSMRRDLGAARR